MSHTGLWDFISETLERLANNSQRDPAFESSGKFRVWHVLRLYLFAALQGYSLCVFYQKLAREKGFRRRWSLPNRIISYSQFKKRLKTPEFLRAMFKLLSYGATQTLKALGTREVRILSMDLTRIESDPRRDPHAAWGIDSKGYFWGYKLGLIISSHGVILGMTLTKGNWGEFNVNRRLIRKARDVIQASFGNIPVDYLLCDSGFDGERTYRAAHQDLGASVLCPPRRPRRSKAKWAKYNDARTQRLRPHRWKDQLLWEMAQTKRLYRQRNEVERVNGQLKDSPFRIAEIPRCRRGIKRLLPVCLAKVIIYNLALNVNAIQNRPIRRINHLVA